jgi:uncharacterized protein
VSREWQLLVFAMAFPTLVAYGYFGGLGGGGAGPNVVAQAAWAAGKLLQLALPLVWVRYAEGRWPKPRAPGWRGLGWGVGFGVLVAAAMLALYFGVLRDSELFREAPARVRQKAEEFGLASPAAFVLFAAFVCCVHSLLEEYYWRWFVFGRLRRLIAPVPAALLAGAAFMAFHVVDLAAFFPGRFWTLAVPLSLGVGIGGVVWCWMYQRTGTVWAPWVSHVLVDAALFAVGYDLCFR